MDLALVYCLVFFRFCGDGFHGVLIHVVQMDYRAFLAVQQGHSSAHATYRSIRNAPFQQSCSFPTREHYSRLIADIDLPLPTTPTSPVLCAMMDVIDPPRVIGELNWQTRSTVTLIL